MRNPLNVLGGNLGDLGGILQRSPKAKIITVHMDTVNHTAVSRADMRKFIRGQSIESRVNVPEDGEIVKLD